MRLISIVVFMILAVVPLRAQQDFLGYLEANLEDAGQLTVDYLEPLVKGVGYGLNTGWYNTAKPHSLGFDLTITANAVFVPDQDQFSTFIASQYQDLELLSPTNGQVPTVFGPEDIEPLYRVPSTGATFNGPPGNDLEDEVGFNAVPVPMITLGIGVIPNLDVKFRFFPLTDLDDDVEVKWWGVGLMHKLNQYFPLGDQLLVDISLFAGYTSLDSELALDGFYDGNNQIGIFKVNSWTLEGVVSYDFKVFTFYGALGYNQVNSDLQALGTYQVDSEIITDPISESFAYDGVKATLGFRVKLAIITLHADYSLNDYNVLTAGFGFNLN